MKRALLIIAILIQLIHAVLHEGAANAVAELTAFLLVVILLLDHQPLHGSRASDD